MLGYEYNDLRHMIESINIAYEIIDGAPDVDRGLEKASDFLNGLWAEGYFD
jgi:hypothetical protein